MKTKNLTVEQQLRRYKKRFRITLLVMGLFVMLTGMFIYINYDYLAFKYFISQHYIYTDALDELFLKELRQDVKGKYFSYFDNLVISTVTRRIREENNDRYTYLFTPDNYKSYLEEEKEEALQSEIIVLDERTIYMRITNFSKYTERFVKDNVKQLKDYPHLIIDLRDNYGGDINAMSKISDLFLPKGSIIATDKLRLFNWTYKSKKKQVLTFENIIVLQNKNTASSSENMVAALKENLDNVTLIGDTTFGKGIGQYTLQLRRGFAVKATILKWFTPKDENIQGKGIEPDILYEGEDIIQFSQQRHSH